jgi:hypothetical protein
MNECRRPSRLSRACRLRKVTLFVPQGCVEGLRQLACELRNREQTERDAEASGWRTLSPSAELMLNAECGARCAVRDTGASGEKRFHWTVAILGRTHPVAAGRTGERAEARLLAEAALRAYAAAGSRSI